MGRYWLKLTDDLGYHDGFIDRLSDRRARPDPHGGRGALRQPARLADAGGGRRPGHGRWPCSTFISRPAPATTPMTAFPESRPATPTTIDHRAQQLRRMVRTHCCCSRPQTTTPSCRRISNTSSPPRRRWRRRREGLRRRRVRRRPARLVQRSTSTARRAALDPVPGVPDTPACRRTPRRP